MQQEIKVRELAEQFFKDEIKKLDDPQRKEEVEHEEETYIGVWMLGFRAGEQHPSSGAVWVRATTRLPTSWHLKCARFIRTKTFLLDPENWLKDNERAIQDVEWLDEGESPSKEGNNISQDAHEKEVIMQAFSKVRQIFEGRQWIMEGRGSYPYSDDRYQEEVRYMYDEFDQLYKDTWHNIKSKSIEYREWIINEYLHKDHPAIHDILTRLGYSKKEGNKDREVTFLYYVMANYDWQPGSECWIDKATGRKPYNNGQLWDEWDNQQNRNNVND